MDIIKGTKRTRTDHIIKGTKRTLILSSKRQTNHKLIIIKGKKTRILSKETSEPLYYHQRNKRTINYYQRKDNQVIIKGTNET